jgi:hypothetical protein
MASRTIKGTGFSKDILVFMRLLSQYRVRYVIVGGEAVIFHGYPRVTGDVDFFYERTPANAERLFNALRKFWDGLVPGVKSAAELRERGIIIQFGRPPYRIDLLNQIDGVSFSAAWKSRIPVILKTASGSVPARYINLLPLLKNKRAAARPKDLEDARYLASRLRSARDRATKAKRRRPRRRS